MEKISTAKINHQPDSQEPLRLHVGGLEQKAGWKICDIVPGEHVDYLCNCLDMSIFADNSVSEIYTSHVLEHFGYDNELVVVLREFYRIMKPGGKLRVSVPDMEVLCQLFVNQELSLDDRYQVMRIIFGGRADAYDVHYVGFDIGILNHYLTEAGFKSLQRVAQFNMFIDSSTITFAGVPISLNVETEK